MGKSVFKKSIKFIFLLVLIFFVCAVTVNLVACIGSPNIQPQDEFSEYRLENNNQIQAYADLKGQDNYSVESWSIVCDLVYEGQALINSAGDKTEIDLTVKETKLKIDEVKPSQTQLIKDGAYFITDTYWDNNNENTSLERSYFWIAVVGDKMTLSANSYAVYSFSKEEGIYKGKTAQNSTINFWILNDSLFICKDNIITQYDFDDSYVVLNSPTRTFGTPQDMEISSGGKDLDYVVLRWLPVSTSGYFGVVVEIKKAESANYEFSKIEMAYSNLFVTQFRQSDFEEGKNLIRLYYLGGPVIQRDKSVILIPDSEYKEISVNVNSDGEVQVEELN